MPASNDSIDEQHTVDLVDWRLLLASTLSVTVKIWRWHNTLHWLLVRDFYKPMKESRYATLRKSWCRLSIVVATPTIKNADAFFSRTTTRFYLSPGWRNEEAGHLASKIVIIWFPDSTRCPEKILLETYVTLHVLAAFKSIIADAKGEKDWILLILKYFLLMSFISAQK